MNKIINLKDNINNCLKYKQFKYPIKEILAECRKHMTMCKKLISNSIAKADSKQKSGKIYTIQILSK